MSALRRLSTLSTLLLFCGSIFAQSSEEGSGDSGPNFIEIEGSGVEGSGAFASEEDDKLAFEDCSPQMDLLLLLDTSGSIKRIYQEHVRWAVELTDSLPVGKDQVRVAAIQYAGFPLTEFALSTYPTATGIKDHLKNMQFRSGVTRTGSALRRAQSELFRSDRGGRKDSAKVIVLFTDGLSLDDPMGVAAELRDIDGVTIYVVGLSDDVFRPEMDGIAGNRARVFGAAHLEQLRDALLDEVAASRRCGDMAASSTADEAKKADGDSPRLQPIDEGNLDGSPETVEPEDLSRSQPPIVVTMQAKPTTTTVAPQPSTTTTDFGTTPLTPSPATNLEGSSASTTTPPTATTSQQAETKPSSSVTAPATTTSTTVGSRASPHVLPSTAEPRTPPTKATTPEKKTSATRFDSLIVEDDEQNRVAVVDGRAILFNSAEEQDRFLPSADCQVDVLVILDSSGSVQDMYDAQKKFIDDVIDELQVGTDAQRMGLVQFAGNKLQKAEFHFDTYRSQTGLKRAFDKVRHFTGTTYIGAALEKSRAMLVSRRSERRTAKTMVVLVSDGYSQDDAIRPAASLRDLQGVEVYAVALGKLNNRGYLEKLTGDAENVFVGDREADVFKRVMRNSMQCRRRRV